MIGPLFASNVLCVGKSKVSVSASTSDRKCKAVAK